MSLQVANVIAADTGCHYPIAPEPMLLDSRLWKQIRDDVESLVNALWQRASPTFPDGPSVARDDLTGRG